MSTKFFFQPVPVLGAVPRQDLEVDVGRRLMEGRDAFRRQRGPGDSVVHKRMVPYWAGAQLPQPLCWVFSMSWRISRPGPGERALLRQLELPAPSDQQGDPKLLLQALDLPGEGGAGPCGAFPAARVMFRSWATVRK